MKTGLHQLPFTDLKDGYLRAICPTCGSLRVHMIGVKTENGYAHSHVRLDVRDSQARDTVSGLPRYPSVHVEMRCACGRSFDIDFYAANVPGDFRGVTIQVATAESTAWMRPPSTQDELSRDGEPS